MKLSLRTFLLVAVLATAGHLSAAERWSSDETAVRMGVNAWVSLWTRPDVGTAAVVKTLYATPPSALLPDLLEAASGKPNAMNQSDKIAVDMQADRAVVKFQLPSAGAAGSQVVLTWERRSGLWRIVQEVITPAPAAAKRVALSESAQK
jgi:hypothetical protein